MAAAIFPAAVTSAAAYVTYTKFNIFSSLVWRMSRPACPLLFTISSDVPLLYTGMLATCSRQPSPNAVPPMPQRASPGHVASSQLTPRADTALQMTW